MADSMTTPSLPSSQPSAPSSSTYTSYAPHHHHTPTPRSSRPAAAFPLPPLPPQPVLMPLTTTAPLPTTSSSTSLHDSDPSPRQTSAYISSVPRQLARGAKRPRPGLGRGGSSAAVDQEQGAFLHAREEQVVENGAGAGPSALVYAVQDESFNEAFGLASAVDTFLSFFAAFEAVEEGSREEWAATLLGYFEKDGRFQLSIVQAGSLRLFDIPATSLPLFLSTLSTSSHLTSHTLTLPHPNISHAQPDLNVARVTVACSDARWTLGYDMGGEAVCTCGISSSWIADDGEGGAGGQGWRMEGVEVLVEGVEKRGEMPGGVGESGWPEEGLRLLQIAEQMEHLVPILQIVDEEKISHTDALRKLVEEGAAGRKRLQDAEEKEQLDPVAEKDAEEEVDGPKGREEDGDADADAEMNGEA